MPLGDIATYICMRIAGVAEYLDTSAACYTNLCRENPHCGRSDLVAPSSTIDFTTENLFVEVVYGS
jgi:hypothetical protein